MKRGMFKFWTLLLGAALLILLAPPPPVAAASAIELSTTYPGITAGPGELLTFPLQISNRDSQSRIVELEIGSRPEEWPVSIEGQGRKINQAFVKAQSSEKADLRIQVPEDAPEGVYTVTVSALLNGWPADSLKLNITVSRTPSGEDRLKAQYKELKGSAGASFVFKLGLTNNANEEKVYSLGADIPQGWQITFKPTHEQQQVAGISVAGGETKNLDVTITPAAHGEAGEYTIPVYAASSSVRVTEELKVIISGTYQMALATPSGRLNASVVAGRDKKISLEIKNNGSAPLNNIKFSAQTPENWAVSFDPQTIDFLGPGESRQIIATVTASSKAIAGDYVVTMRASADETVEPADFRITVKTSTLWGVVGIALVILVCAGVYRVFHKYGRR